MSSELRRSFSPASIDSQMLAQRTGRNATTASAPSSASYIYKFPDHLRGEVDPEELEAVAQSKAIKLYETLPKMADFRRWQVELRCTYWDKDGNEIDTVVVSPNDL